MSVVNMPLIRLPPNSSADACYVISRHYHQIQNILANCTQWPLYNMAFLGICRTNGEKGVETWGDGAENKEAAGGRARPDNCGKHLQ